MYIMWGTKVSTLKFFTHQNEGKNFETYFFLYLLKFVVPVQDGKFKISTTK